MSAEEKQPKNCELSFTWSSYWGLQLETASQIALRNSCTRVQGGARICRAFTEKQRKRKKEREREKERKERKRKKREKEKEKG